MYVIAVTWIFWIVVSLWNLPFLLGLAVPPLILIMPGFYLKFWHFLALPFLAVIAVSLFVIPRVISRPASVFAKTLIANFTIFIAFVVVAESSSYLWMTSATNQLDPDCFDRRFFISSLAIAGTNLQFDVHAVYRKDGNVFLWSYRELGFFQVPKTTYQNLNLLGCRPNS